MTPKTRKIIGISLIALAVTYLVLKRRQNEKEAEAIIDYANQSITQNDLQKAGDELVQKSSSIQYDASAKKQPVVIDGKSYSLPKDAKAATHALIPIVTGIFKSVSGAGTNVSMFMQNFSKLQSPIAYKMANDLYKGIYKNKDMFTAMSEEEALHPGSVTSFLSKFLKFETLGLTDVVNAGWNDAITNQMKSVYSKYQTV